MTCTHCGRENRAGARFCSGCGGELARACPGCGQPLAHEAQFCDSCGQSLREPSEVRTPTLPPAPALPASFASGRYQVQRFLGEGGKKRVYLARDTRLDRDVAIAFIRAEGLDAEGLTRVRREAQAMGRLGDHPHIVTVHDIGEEGGQPFLVQEYMAGGSLEDLLRGAQGHRLPVDEALRIAGQIADALAHAHGRGIIHRDLKPGNIWLSGEGLAKLGDFGLAVALDRSRLTREGMMVGTASYMPPEQALGGEVTARSDLYALGCALYEMVTGRPPFLGDETVAVISQHLNTAPVAPSWHNQEVPRSLEALILRLLAKSPNDRPESAQGVVDELRRIAERTTEETPAAAPAASDLLGFSWGAFAGRREEMDQLKIALENTLSGRGSLVMLVGEPGIGKTRLAEEFGVYGTLRGAQVLTGRCYEGEVALPYRPFVEAFRQYARGRPDPALREELGDGAPEVAKLVSEVRQRFPDIPEAAPLEPDAERLRLHESVSAFVHNAAQANPLVLFLDDIHWADKPSLLMLRYLARAIAGDRVLLLGAYRDVELDRTHPLSEMIATLRREQPYQRVLLRGLPQEDVLAWLGAIEPSEEVAAGREGLAAALFQETEGNPFFIREVLSHLVDEGKIVHEGGRWVGRVSSASELGIPEGVRDVIGRRLSRLSEGCNRMLTAASTMTGGFTWDELKAITGGDEAALLDLLDEALAAQLIQERQGDQEGKYDFTHALIRQTLYGELSTPRRVLLHRQIGQALEGHYAANLDPHLGELAHHFFQAAPGGDVDRAIDYAQRAGDRAVDVLAYEEAASHYELALQAVELKDRPEERQHYDLVMALGLAYFRSDVTEKATSTLEEAVQIGERLHEPELAGHAAVAYADAVGRGPLAGTQAAGPVLGRALAALPGDDSGLRAELLAQMSMDLSGVGTAMDEQLRQRVIAHAEQAKEMAERVGDIQALARALQALRIGYLGPQFTEERLAIADEFLRAAERAGARPLALFGRLVRDGDLAELGDMDAVRREQPVMWDLADQMRQPFYSGWRPSGGAQMALMEGRFDAAEQFISQLIPVALRTQNPNWTRAMNAQVYELRRAQGRLDELEPLMLNMEQDQDIRQVVQIALAYLYRTKEDVDRARQWFERVAAHNFADVPGTAFAMTTMLFSADVAKWLKDQPRAALLYDMLLPYAERQVVLPILLLCDGSASRPLGQLAATLGRWDDAERHFEFALAFDERIGARPWLARTQYEYADMLRGRGQPDDREKALTLANKALATFEELGMPRDVEWALALKMDLQGIAGYDVKTSIDTVAVAVNAERPDLRPHAAPDGTVTLLFTDIEGSTPLNERIGDRRWMDILRVHHAIVRDQIAAHGGFEVKSQGDGFMVAFGSARRALECAIAVQRAVSSLGEKAEEPYRLRVGLHTGEAIREADDFYGRHVNLAARIASQARGDEILVSSLLKELTAGAGEFEFDEGREVTLKGLSGTQRVFEVRWRD